MMKVEKKILDLWPRIQCSWISMRTAHCGCASETQHNKRRVQIGSREARQLAIALLMDAERLDAEEQEAIQIVRDLKKKFKI